ncbi:T cell receptor beta constant 2 [Megalops cyprinoides]|uniref:T cell receptor beta constant 2 n=1 Tax=Megalops cyprinoides TaxID=118141 RepID=UPI0018643F87|nr:T cell receptor beta constant 2 [Megalops cyprinoides]
MQTFGKGTKLTVLDPNITVTPPEVRVLPPSPREACHREEEGEEDPEVTLVCVATDFYPDHISVSWQVNGMDSVNGTGTDNAALWDAKKRSYSITSRLRVQATVWLNPENSFTCITTFYNGSNYLNQNYTIYGKTEKSMWKDLRAARLVYSCLLYTSVLYALVVSALVWKLMIWVPSAANPCKGRKVRSSLPEPGGQIYQTVAGF